jgi:hypothetical protein
MRVQELRCSGVSAAACLVSLVHAYTYIRNSSGVSAAVYQQQLVLSLFPPTRIHTQQHLYPCTRAAQQRCTPLQRCSPSLISAYSRTYQTHALFLKKNKKKAVTHACSLSLFPLCHTRIYQLPLPPHTQQLRRVSSAPPPPCHAPPAPPGVLPSRRRRVRGGGG